MASGTVYIDDTFKGKRGNVLSVGRVLLGQNATINPRDVGMRYIKSIAFSPWPGYDNFAPGSIGSYATRWYRREFRTMSGSIGSLGALDASTGSATPVGNYVRVRSYRVRTFGSSTGLFSGPQGTKGVYFGTVGGSMRASYIAVGR